MSKQTDVKRIYWEEEDSTLGEHGDMRMIFELTDGRKMELAVYGEEPAEAMGRSMSVITNVFFQEI